jgi:hypothetical protein
MAVSTQLLRTTDPSVTQPTLVTQNVFSFFLPPDESIQAKSTY